MRIAICILSLILSFPVFSQIDTLHARGQTIDSVYKPFLLHESPPTTKSERKISAEKKLVIAGSCLLGTSPVLAGLSVLCFVAGGNVDGLDLGLMGAGALFALMGTANILAGIPLVIIGAVKMKRAKSERSSLTSSSPQLQGVITSNGHIGLALKF